MEHDDEKTFELDDDQDEADRQVVRDAGDDTFEDIETPEYLICGKRSSELRERIEALEDESWHDDDPDAEAELAGLKAQQDVYDRRRREHLESIPETRQQAWLLAGLTGKRRRKPAEPTPPPAPAPVAIPAKHQPSKRPSRLKLNLLDNALHSLEAGMRYYGDPGADSKFAIQLVSQAVELLLKHWLAQHDMKAIFDAKGRTKEIGDIVSALKRRGLLEKSEGKAITAVNAWNNDAKHYELDLDSNEVTAKLGGVLKIAMKILEDHLGLEPTEHIDQTTYVTVEQAVYEYDELLRRAEARADAGMDPKEQSLFAPGWCSQCEHNTVNDEGYCTYCREHVGTSECSWCGDTTSELTGSGECETCATRHDDE